MFDFFIYTYGPTILLAILTAVFGVLGYGAKNTYNRYCFEESSPINNLFLGLKYMLERGGASAMKENNYFTEIHHYGDVYLLENNAYLPLGFLSNSELSDLDWNSNVDNFTFQNRLLTAASGVGNAWNVLGSETLNVAAEGGAVISSQSSLGSSSYTCSGSDGTVVYTYSPDRDGLLCIDLNLFERLTCICCEHFVHLLTCSYKVVRLNLDIGALS